ncbi:hypothetical protein [Roseibium aggregatum]|uniref:Uncharacterized protein n=1 Tax=Roseibium aggregatum TaxID=187304 RepID=A0A939EJV7_9HYPH|nr:hypothetical protein [Roseibium aggregatum]MBN9673747.1 hypothetical protein [Roseibium aggregatum]
MKHSRISPDDTAVRYLGVPGWSRLPLSVEPPEAGGHYLPRHVRLLIALNIVSGALALLLLAGLVLSWSSNAELNTVRQELKDLQRFEKRILARLDTMNNGVQHRLAKIDRRMGVIQSDVGLVTRGRRDPAVTVESIATMVRDSGGYFGTATAELLLAPELSEQSTQRFVPDRSTPGLSFSDGGAPEGDASLFKRVVTEDGKVRYEMRR